MLLNRLRPFLIRTLNKSTNLTSLSLRHINATFGLRSSETSGSSQIDFNNDKLQKYLESIRQEFYDLRVNSSGEGKALSRMNQLNGVVRALEQYRTLEKNIVSKEVFETEKDEDMRQLMKEENEVYSELLRKTESELLSQLVNVTDDEFYPSLIFEIKSGAGGQEAMLFSKQLFDMYINFFNINGWDFDIIEENSTDIGGLRHANIVLNSPEAYDQLKYEAGVHRVQRVPVTEKSGRIHTSTASVSVIPKPADVNVTIVDKDLKIETKRASGAGGQHVNTTDSAVRIIHIPTGIAIECQSERSQIKNREIAIMRLQNKLLRMQLESAEATTKATRKSQQGNLNRNEKIRTYNFVQDRVTDHRLNGNTVHNIKEFMEGGEHLGQFIDNIVLQYKKQKLVDMIASWNNDSVENDKIKHKLN